MWEIKFRGKSVRDNGWVCGDLRQNHGGKTTITYLGDGKYITSDVDPETVGQYIGIHDDEDENELYEGDLIEMIYQEEKIVCSIEYCGGGYLLASDDFEDGFKWITDVTENDGRFFWIPTAVKIGNMTDDRDRFCT